MPSRRRTTTTLAALALVASGCGGSGGDGDAAGPDPRKADEAAVRETIAVLQRKAVIGDGSSICNDVFTPKLANSITKSADSGSCSQEVRENLFSPGTRLAVESVTVSPPSDATATVREADGTRSTVSLVRQGGKWRIRGVAPA